MRVGIAGATGYTGIELLRLLHEHPRAQVVWALARRQAGQPIGTALPHLQQSTLGNLVLQPPAALTEGRLPAVDVAFLALPHGAAGPTAAYLRHQGVRVIDLSADFRLEDADLHREWYGAGDQALPPQKLRDEAVYGLPELFRTEIEQADLVANPGCYPTVSTLAVAPLAARGLVDLADLIFDCKSGVSGAGRGASLTTHYGEVNENIRAYSVAGRHRHIPEIEQSLRHLAGQDVTITFTPHLVPMTRGILATVYARLTDASMDEDELLTVYKEFYAASPFVRIHPLGSWPATKAVQGSNFCDIGLALDGRTRRLVVTAAIDNLVKGAAGQAIQNFNLMAGLAEETGLGYLPLYP